MSTRSLGTLTLDLIAKIGGFQDGMDQAARSMRESTSQISKAADSISEKFQDLAGSAKALVGVFGVEQLFGKFLEETLAAESAITRLNAVLISTHGAAGVSAHDVTELANQLEGLTGVSKTSITAAAGILLQYDKIGGATFPKALQASLDLAAALGVDVTQAAQSVGLGLQQAAVGADALRIEGLRLTDTQKALVVGIGSTGNSAGAMDLVLQQLGTQTGGLAKAMGDSLPGEISKLKNAFNDLFEVDSPEEINKIGGAVTRLTGTLKDPALKEGIQTLASVGIWAAGKVGLGLGVTGKTFDSIFDLVHGDIDRAVSDADAGGELIKKILGLSVTEGLKGGGATGTFSPPEDRFQDFAKDLLNSTSEIPKTVAEIIKQSEAAESAAEAAAAAFAKTNFDLEGGTLNSISELSQKTTTDVGAAIYTQTMAAKKAADDFAEYQKHVAAQLLGGAQILDDGLKNAFDDMINTGKFSIDSFIKFMLAEFSRKEIFKAIDDISDALDKLAKKGGGGGSTGFLGGLFNIAAGLFTSDFSSTTGASATDALNAAMKGYNASDPFTVPGFATGGSGVVGGSGGPDSKLIQLRVTPGELVNVSKGQPSGAAPIAYSPTINISGLGLNEDQVGRMLTKSSQQTIIYMSKQINRGRFV